MAVRCSDSDRSSSVHLQQGCQGGAGHLVRFMGTLPHVFSALCAFGFILRDLCRESSCPYISESSGQLPTIGSIGPPLLPAFWAVGAALIFALSLLPWLGPHAQCVLLWLRVQRVARSPVPFPVSVRYLAVTCQSISHAAVECSACGVVCCSM